MHELHSFINQFVYFVIKYGIQYRTLYIRYLKYTIATLHYFAMRDSRYAISPPRPRFKVPEYRKEGKVIKYSVSRRCHIREALFWHFNEDNYTIRYSYTCREKGLSERNGYKWQITIRVGLKFSVFSSYLDTERNKLRFTEKFYLQICLF